MITILFFKPYFDILPSNANSNPFYFSEEDKELCKGTSIFNNYKRDLNNYHSIYKIFALYSTEFKKISLEAFVLYSIILGSRYFGLNQNTDNLENSTGALCPFIDLLNYDIEKSKNVYIMFDFHIKCFKLIANENISSGEEIFLDYGNYSNDDLLYYYGFVDPKNFYTSKLIDFTFQEKDEYVEDRLEYLRISKESKIKVFLSNEYKENEISVLRVLLYRGKMEEINKFIFNQNCEESCFPTKFSIYISKENELKVLSWVYEEFTKSELAFNPSFNQKEYKLNMSQIQKNIEIVIRNQILFIEDTKEMCAVGNLLLNQKLKNLDKYKNAKYFQYLNLIKKNYNL